jgi:ATP-binding cassette subfamily B (MDR/TAP) protein 1
MAGPANASHNETAMTTDRDDKGGTTGKATEPSGPQATLEEVFSFVPNTKTKILMIFGLFFAACSGVIFPAMAWIFSGSFSDLSASTDSDAYMRAIRELAFSFIALGVVAFALMTAQTLLMELAASEVTRNFKKLWFQALLRQDMAYYDLRDVSGTATTLSANAIKFKRSV